MKATPSVNQNTAPEVILDHKGEQLVFSISVFGRKQFQAYDVFEYINKYWESLPMEQQDQLFQLYKDIQYAFQDVLQRGDLFDQITNLVKQLMTYHDLENIRSWMTFKSDIHVPDIIENEYTHSIDNNTSREKTYTRSDYVQLVALSICLKAMIPVWGEYVLNIRHDTGTKFKEYFAFQIINETSIIHSTAMDKLRVYIEHIVGDDKNDPNNTLDGICSEDFGFWLLSLVCIRRLCLGDVKGVDPQTHLIKFIYKFIIQKIRNTDNDMENAVKEKKLDDKGQSSENKISTLEWYKIKTNIAPGEIVELENSLKDIRQIAYRLSSNLNPELLERSIATAQVLMSKRLLDPQMTLLRWVFKPVISPKGLMYLPKKMIVDALGVLEAVLWTRGYKYLSILATSYPVILDSDMMISPVDSKTRVPKELSDELDRLYPYSRVTNNRRTGMKETNLAAESINTMSDNLTMFSWRSSAHEEMLQDVFSNVNRRFPIVPMIKIDLTKLVIEIGSRSWI